MQKTINAAWHAKHKLARNASLEERLDWHLAHAANCACRPMPPSIREAAAKAHGRPRMSADQPSKSRRARSPKPKSR